MTCTSTRNGTTNSLNGNQMAVIQPPVKAPSVAAPPIMNVARMVSTVLSRTMSARRLLGALKRHIFSHHTERMK